MWVRQPSRFLHQKLWILCKPCKVNRFTWQSKVEVLELLKIILRDVFMNISSFIPAKISKAIEQNYNRKYPKIIPTLGSLQDSKVTGCEYSSVCRSTSCAGGTLEVDIYMWDKGRFQFSHLALRYGHHWGWEIRRPIPEMKLFRNGLSCSLTMELEF